LLVLFIPFGFIVILWQVFKNKIRWGDGFAGTIVLDLNKRIEDKS